MIEIHGEENLLVLVHRVWAWRRPVGIGAAIGGFFSLILFIFLIPQYEATMIISPVLQDGRDGIFLGAERGGARDIAAESWRGAASSPEFMRFEQIFREQSVASVLIKYEDMMLKVREDRTVRLGGTHLSSSAELAEYLKDKVEWEPIGASPSRRLSYRHPDPEFAAKFLSRIHKITDELIRTQARVETDEQISWIKKELGKTVNPDHRQALAQLLMGEERRRMLISMDRPYAAMVVEPAASRARPVSPQHLLLFLVMSLIGGMSGFFLWPVFLRNNRHD